MKRGFKLLLVCFLIACAFIFAILVFTWLLRFVLVALFGAMGKVIVIFVIICALITAVVYNILEED